MSSQDVLQKLFDILSFSQAHISVTEDADHIKVDVEVSPEESGVLIGYHGETIDALQLIVAQMLNQNQANYIPVEVDVNGYRGDRQKNLEDLATKAADNAVHSGREIILPPLSSRERRIVHVHLSERDDVTTYSEGVGPSRRLVVRPQV